jgi:hypothetical protein
VSSNTGTRLPLQETAQVKVDTIEATIPDGNSESQEINLNGTTIVGIHHPSGTGFASFTLQVASELGGDYRQAFDIDGVAITITSAPDTYTQINPFVTAGMRFIKLVSNTNASGDTDIKLSVRDIE